jgi:hypothetical protein
MLRTDPLKPALAAAALLFLAVGLWMVFEPAGFQTTVGGFGATNEHLIGDLATFNLALAGVLGTAAVRSSWRLPVLWFANIQNALHLVNHVADADEAHPLWLGMANVWALLATGVVLAVLLIASSRTASIADKTAAATAESGVR